MTSIKYIILSLFLSLIAFSNVDAQLKKKRKSRKKKHKTEVSRKPLTDKEKMLAEDLFLEGNKYVLLKDYKRAIEKLDESYKIDPTQGATCYYLATSYAQLNAFASAKQYAIYSVEIDSTNFYYLQLLGNLYRATDEAHKAVDLYEKMTMLPDASIQTYVDLASLYNYLNEPKKAIGVLNRTEVQYGIQEPISRTKQKLYLRLNDLDNAIKEGKSLMDAFPDEPDFGAQQAQLLLSNEKIKESKSIIDQYRETFPQAPSILLVQFDYYLKTENLEQQKEISKVILEHHEIVFEDKKRLVSMISKSLTPEENLEMSKLIYLAHPDLGESNMLYGDFLFANGESKKAQVYYLKAAELNGNNIDLWRQIISLDFQNNEIDSVITHAEKAIEYFPNQAILYYFAGYGYYSKKEYDIAIDHLEQANLMVSNPKLKSDINALLGDAFHSTEDYDKSDKAFREVLAVDPNNIHVLNNYSYFLSLRKDKLDDALVMAEKLISLEPNNDTYLDTYGWVLYIREDYQKAVEVLRKAANSTSDGTVLEHYGDALFKTGNIEEAIKWWQKAVENNPDDAEKLEQKIKEKKLIE